MEAVAESVLPPGTGFEWTEFAFRERNTGNTAVLIFGLSVLFVYLALSAQNESWTLPLAIVLIVPLGILAALLGSAFRGLDNDIPTQVRLVVLIGPAAMNTMQIIEVAPKVEDQGESPADAVVVVEASRLRLRPDRLAFILGVVPLAIATATAPKCAGRVAQRCSPACSARRSSSCSSLRSSMSPSARSSAGSEGHRLAA